MSFVNRMAFFALLVCGFFLVGGATLDRPQLSWVGAFVGWFLAAYSIVVYLVQATRAALASKLVFWPSLIPVNCALALLGIATFGVVGASVSGLLIASAAAIALAATLVVRTTPRPTLKWLPFVALSPLIIPFIGPLSWSWTYVFVGVAVLLLTMSAGSRLKLTRHSAPN